MDRKILIIDDDAQDIQDTIKALEQAGFANVVWAADGRAGLEMVEKENPDVIVIDVVLPDMDGFSLCDTLQRVKRVPARIILTTGVIQMANALKARTVGADDFVLKESKCYQLIKAIRDVERQIELEHNFETMLHDLKSGAIGAGAKKDDIKKKYPGAMELQDGSLVYVFLTVKASLALKLYFKDDALVDWEGMGDRQQ